MRLGEKVIVGILSTLATLSIVVLVSVITSDKKTSSPALSRLECVDTVKWKVGYSEQDVCVKQQWVILDE